MSHTKCINGEYCNTGVMRSTHPDTWKYMENDERYFPIFFEDDILHKNPKPIWADNEDPKTINFEERFNETSFGNFNIDMYGYPLNPIGPTGIRGRGVLGKWGPNCAADPLVTRWKRDDSNNIILVNSFPILQFVAIKRRDTGDMAIPGGMVEPGEEMSLTAKREFGEEALNSLEMSEDSRTDLSVKLESFFKDSHCIYEGYVDDPRNTDNAWMVTKCFLWHDNKGHVMSNFELNAGDDACEVMWYDYTYNNTLNLYASHAEFVKTAYLYLGRKYGYFN
jgi:ADP-ribose pyrophosphatase